MEKSQELIGILQAISIVAKSLAAKLMQIFRVLRQDQRELLRLFHQRQ